METKQHASMQRAQSFTKIKKRSYNIESCRNKKRHVMPKREYPIEVVTAAKTFADKLVKQQQPTHASKHGNNATAHHAATEGTERIKAAP